MSKQPYQNTSSRILPALLIAAILVMGCGEDLTSASKGEGWRLGDPSARAESPSPGDEPSMDAPTTNEDNTLGEDPGAGGVGTDGGPGVGGMEPGDAATPKPDTTNKPPFPAAPTGCPTGLPWEVATKDATVNHVLDEGGGAIEVALDGGRGGHAYLRLPPVGGDIDVTVHFEDLQTSPHGSYEVRVALYNPLAEKDAHNYDTHAAYMNGEVSTRGKSFSNLWMSGAVNDSGMTGEGDLEAPTSGHFRVRRNESESVVSVELVLENGDGFFMDDYEIDAESDLQLFLVVRGNTLSDGAMVRLTGVEAMNSNGELHDDDFGCASFEQGDFEPGFDLRALN